MEVKKTQQLSAPADVQGKNFSAKAGEVSTFLAEVKEEFGKINWTSPDELRAYTKIVVATTFLFGMGIYFMDVIIQVVLNTLGSVVRLFGG